MSPDGARNIDGGLNSNLNLSMILSISMGER